MDEYDNSLAGPAAHVMFRGARLHPSALDIQRQRELLAVLREVLAAVPLIEPITPGGRKMSVRMSAAGRFGWITDRSGYRYAEHHPSGTPWPPIPPVVMGIWHEFSGCGREPECCLINWYGEGARMGLHQDRDEADFSCPVVSVSLGDDALFRMGGPDRRSPTASTWLRSGEVVVLEGDARLAFHGVDRTRFGSGSLLSPGGRINLTLRVVT